MRETVEAVAALAPPRVSSCGRSPTELRPGQVQREPPATQAADGGYVRNLEDKRGKPGRWVIGDPLPEAADLLPDPAQLRNTEQHA